jgi:type 1 glutamine amidotransferase
MTESSPTRLAIPAAERQLVEQAIPRQASAAARKPRKLLVSTLNIRDGKTVEGHASIAHGNFAIELMGRATGAYQAVFSNEPTAFDPANLQQFDAVCFNNTCGVLFEDPRLRASLLEFVSSGKGFFGLHAAAATFVQWPRYDQWPAFGDMLGAYENGGHPWKPDETITLRVEELEHPLNAAFSADRFDVTDQVFQFQQPYSRDTLRILLSIDTDKSDMNPTRRFLAERMADMDFAIAWIRMYGKGRVFYSSLGHNPHVFWDARLLQHFLAGLQFALGDLKADATPSGSSRRQNPLRAALPATGTPLTT